VTLTNSTVSGNEAPAPQWEWGSIDRSSSGEIYNEGGMLALNNTIVALNDAPTYADIQGDFTRYSSLVGGNPRFVNAAAGDYRLSATSVPSILNLWVQPLELDAGIGSGELPVDAGLAGIAVGLPGSDLPLQDGPVADQPAETLSR